MYNYLWNNEKFEKKKNTLAYIKKIITQQKKKHATDYILVKHYTELLCYKLTMNLKWECTGQ